MDHGRTTPQDPVDQGGLPDIGPTDDSEDGQPGLRDGVRGRNGPTVQQGEVLLLELVVGQAPAQGLGAQCVPAIALSGLIEGLLDQGDDVLDGLRQIHVGGVHEGDAVRSREELGDGGVVPVPAEHLVAQGGGVDALARGLQIGGATGESSLLAGGDEQTRVRVGRDDGGDVAALGHDAGAVGEGAGQARGLGVDELALEAGELGANVEVGGDPGDDGGDAGVADGGGDVLPAAHDARGLGIQPHLQGHGLDRPRHGVRAIEVDALVLAPPGGGPVHGAGVEVGQAEPGGDALRDGRFARSARPVDRDDDSHVLPPDLDEPVQGSHTRRSPPTHCCHEIAHDGERSQHPSRPIAPASQ